MAQIPQTAELMIVIAMIMIMIMIMTKTTMMTTSLILQFRSVLHHTRVETLIVATIYLQLIQNTYMFRSFTVLQCSHQHCVQPVASDVEVVGYL